MSYSHKDESFRSELDSHLAMLKRQKVVDVFTDHCIPAGGEFDDQIRRELEQADVVLLLVSSYFLNSEYCFGIEMQRSMERHEAGSCVVVPIIVRDCDWEPAPFHTLKALPRDGLPVASWKDPHEAFADVARSLRSMLGGSPVRSQAPPSLASSPSVSPVSARAPSSLTRLPRTITDQDRHDFTQTTFETIKAYFVAALNDLQRENEQIESRLTETSARGFQVAVFQNGRKVGGCYIRIGGFGASGIAYTSGDAIAENAYNEMLSIEEGDGVLYLRATMAMFDSRLTHQMSPPQAAEYLLGKLLSPLHQR